MNGTTETGGLSVNDDSLSIIITLPSDVDWTDYQRELFSAEHGSILNFKVPVLPRRVGPGSRCYVIYKGFIRGWHTICGFSEKEFVCTTTGNPFKGKFIERTGKFNYLPVPIPHKGFQGFRYFKLSDYLSELKSDTLKENYEQSKELNAYTELENIETYDNIDYVFLYPKTSEADKVYFRNNLDRIYDFLEEGYKYAEIEGGFQGFTSHKDMKRKTSLCILAFKDNIMIAVSIHNNYIEGDKCVGMTVTTSSEYRRLGVIALVRMISYMTKNWNEWLWIEASGKIELMYENAQKLLENSDSEIKSTKLPVELSMKIMAHKEPERVDEYHYRRWMKVFYDDEEKDIRVRKVIFGFPSKEIYDEYIRMINQQIYDVDSPVTEGYSHSVVRNAYMTLISLIDFANTGDYEYISPEMKNAYMRSIRILQRSKDDLGPQREYVDDIIANAEYILKQVKPPKPKSLVNSLIECGLI